MPAPGIIAVGTTRFDHVINNLLAGVPQFSPVVELYSAIAAESVALDPFTLDDQAYIFAENYVYYECAFDANYALPAALMIRMEYGAVVAGAFVPAATGIDYGLAAPHTGILYRFSFPKWAQRYLRLRFIAVNDNFVQITGVIKGEIS